MKSGSCPLESAPGDGVCLMCELHRDGGLAGLMRVLQTFDLKSVDVYAPPKTANRRKNPFLPTFSGGLKRSIAER